VSRSRRRSPAAPGSTCATCSTRRRRASSSSRPSVARPRRSATWCGGWR